MPNNGPTLEQLADNGVVPPSQFETQPERIEEVADHPLRTGNLKSILDSVSAGGLFEQDAVEEAVTSLIGGHLLLAGPPGTGKTQLARLLASAFQAELVEETANPEWSVYDVIGALALPGAASPYRDGLLTRAVIKCAEHIVKHWDTGEGPQATWLLIDEINRAEIDRAFGPLFTAMSSDDVGRFTLDHRPTSPVMSLPRRFRIIATMNSYDTRFVNSMSAALRRRFGRVTILPPPNEGTLSSDAEMTLAIQEAEARVRRRLGDAASEPAAVMTQQRERMREVFGAVRHLGDKGGVPIGTAQVMDCLTFLATLMVMKGVPSSDEEFLALFDHALSARLFSAIESDASRSRLRPGYAEAFSTAYPALTRSVRRLNGFLSGVD